MLSEMGIPASNQTSLIPPLKPISRTAVGTTIRVSDAQTALSTQSVHGRAKRQVWLTESGSNVYRLQGTIILDVSREDDGSYIVSEDMFNLYGVGDTLAEAVSDYQDMLIEHYSRLAEAEEMLSDYLKQQLRALSQLLERL